MTKGGETYVEPSKIHSFVYFLHPAVYVAGGGGSIFGAVYYQMVFWKRRSGADASRLPGDDLYLCASGDISAAVVGSVAEKHPQKRYL